MDYIFFILGQEPHYKEADVTEWRTISKASKLESSYQILKRDLFIKKIEDQLNSKGSHSLSADIAPTDTESYEVVCVHSPNKKTNVTYLLNMKETKEEKEEKQCMLLIDGSIETNDFDSNSLDDFFQGQIEADKKAFKYGRIYYPIYEMLSTVSKLIKHRKTVYSVLFTGKRKVSYQNSFCAEHTIQVNPEDGCFMINDSDTKYIEYLPSVSVDNLWDIRKEKCYKFADRPNMKLAKILDSGIIVKAWNDCEVTVYIDRIQIGNILIGLGEETEKKRKVLNYVDGEITYSPEIKL